LKRAPTEIQVLTIPLLLGKDVDIIAQAQTGTGKTAAFALPLIEKLDPRKRGVKAIILAPTRELVIQVSEEIESLKGNSDINTAAIYGGQFINIQLRKLEKGVDIVVGTPGRVLDHIRRKTLVLDRVEYFILDEADEMLNMGFLEDIEEIFGETPDEKRVLLFSATMPERIRKLAESYMEKYVHVRSEPQLTTDLTEQIYFEVRRKDKFEALMRVLEVERDFYGIVFCRTKVDVGELTSMLIDRGMRADNLHGDIPQPLREKILGKFRDRKINILVATDVAARGIDVIELTHVINYSIPRNPEDYVHRIGRTGRAGKKGTAITFVTPTELIKMKFIQKFTKAEIVKQRAPDRNEIADIRRKRVESEIDGLISRKETEGYRRWARNLMEVSSGEDIITALLKYSFGKDLEEIPGMEGKKAGEGIVEGRRRVEGKTALRKKEPSETGGNSRMVRLSIAMGRKEKMNRGKVLELIGGRAGTPPEMIEDIEIADDRSYITVPSREAKSILKQFRRSYRNDKPLIMKVRKDLEEGKNGNPPERRPHRKKKGRFARP